MDILTKNVFFLTIFGVILLTFFTYSTLIIRKRSIKACFRQMVRGVTVVLVIIGKFVINAVSLLTRSARTPRSNVASNNAARGGIFNYRTRKFDDGTDPAGLYDKD